MAGQYLQHAEMHTFHSDHQFHQSQTFTLQKSGGNSRIIGADHLEVNNHQSTSIWQE
jgi:hypothetical protein